MKRKTLLVILALVFILTILFPGCVPSSSGSSDKSAPSALSVLQQQVTAMGTTQAAMQADIAVLKSKGSDTGALESKLNTLQNNLSTMQSALTSLQTSDTDTKARLKVLEEKVASGTTTTTTSGTVTATIKEGTPLYLYSTTSASSITFTVHVTNGFSGYQYVNFSLSIMRISGAGDVTAANLSRFTYATTYTPTPAIPAANCAQVLFIPSANSAFALAGGQSVDVACQVSLTTSVAEQWQIILIPVNSPTWF